MSYCELEMLPNEVEKLVHLRYLDLSSTKLLELPETVCNLYNLQFLGLKECEELRKLPEKIGKLCNLRHLDIEETDALNHLSKSVAALSSLRSLCKFIVSDGDRWCKIGDLQLLNNLEGVLELKGLSQVTDEEDATRADLKKKQYLRELRFDFKVEEEEGSGVRIGMKNVLDKLEPHEDLEILEIRDYSDSHFPGWVGSRSSLASVVAISLFRCRECIELPGFGNLGFLKKLEIRGMGSVTSIGKEFYGDGAEKTAFPKLEYLVIEDMEKLEEWEVPISKHRKIMPLLVNMELKKSPKFRALPCLGSLESLEKLQFEKLLSVKYIGKEFYGFDDGDSSLGVGMIAFPKLRELKIFWFEELDEWEIPTSKEDRKIMPVLSQLKLSRCYKLRALPRVWRMEALEELELRELDSVKGGVGVEFGDGDNEDVGGVTFPKLTRLEIFSMRELEEWSVPLITPCLKKLKLSYFPKLKRLPTFHGCVETLESLEIEGMHSWEGQEKIVTNDSGRQGVAVRGLAIRYCPKLRVVPDYLFSPSIVELELQGDVGVLYDHDSFSDYANKLCSLTQLTLRNLPRLCGLPNGFDQLKTLQSLKFSLCKTLDFDLKELAHFTQLRNLRILKCPLLEERFKGEDDWRTILAHLHTITVDWEEITKNKN